LIQIGVLHHDRSPNGFLLVSYNLLYTANHCVLLL
jgi:hypothetical protein